MQAPGRERGEERRRSPIVEISMLLAECLQHGLRTIAFCKTRKLCELVTAYTRDLLAETAPAYSARLAVYRCALLPSAKQHAAGACAGRGLPDRAALLACLAQSVSLAKLAKPEVSPDDGIMTCPETTAVLSWCTWAQFASPSW